MVFVNDKINSYVLKVKGEGISFIKHDLDVIIEKLSDSDLEKASKGEGIRINDRRRFKHDRWDQWINAHNRINWYR